MSGSWEPVTKAPPEGVPELAPIVVAYTAVVSLELERSALSITPPSKDKKVVEALRSSPEWVETPWSETQAIAASRGNTTENLTVFALAKIRALLDFSAGLPGGSPGEIHQGIAQRWPKVAAERGRARSGRLSTVYNKIQVEAFIRNDGQPGWGYTVGSGGEPLPGFDRTNLSAAGEFDRYLQNTIRADIAERLSASS